MQLILNWYVHCVGAWQAGAPLCRVRFAFAHCRIAKAHWRRRRRAADGSELSGSGRGTRNERNSSGGTKTTTNGHNPGPTHNSHNQRQTRTQRITIPNGIRQTLYCAIHPLIHPSPCLPSTSHPIMFPRSLLRPSSFLSSFTRSFTTPKPTLKEATSAAAQRTFSLRLYKAILRSHRMVRDAKG